MAICQAAKEVAWLIGLLEDFELDLRSPLVILGDNQGPLALTQTPGLPPTLEAYRHPVPLHSRPPSSVFQQKLWWMMRLQSRSLPLPRLIVDRSRVRVPVRTKDGGRLYRQYRYRAQLLCMKGNENQVGG